MAEQLLNNNETIDEAALLMVNALEARIEIGVTLLEKSGMWIHIIILCE